MKISSIVAGHLILLASSPLFAENLVDVYHQAVNNDPTFKKADATWMGEQENIAIARAGNGTPGSGLFPYIGLQANLQHTYAHVDNDFFAKNGSYNTSNALISITQPIFNFATWKAISGAKYSVKAASATYLASQQDLISRTAQAYFNVLSAAEKLNYTKAQKQSFYQQLYTAKEKVKVGLIPVTNLYDAQASYDSATSQEIQYQNDLANRLEELRAITGKTYAALDGLQKTIPLVTPNPRNIDAWVKIAENQSYAIKASEFTLLAAQEKVKQTAAAGYPTLNANASFGVQKDGIPPGVPNSNITQGPPAPGTTATFNSTRSATVGLSLNFPIFQGGFVKHTTKQQQYNYLSASDQLEYVHRNTEQQTREAYLAINSGINKIRADQQAIKSARNKMDSTKAAYDAGTSTMVDVLNAVTNYYQAEQQWSADRYAYVQGIITLKQQAGTLSPSDIGALNKWLSKSVDVKQPA